MSGGRSQVILKGAILQHGCEVGGIDVPEPADRFIEAFNREYAPLGMSIQLKPPQPLPSIAPPALHHSDEQLASLACS